MERGIRKRRNQENGVSQLMSFLRRKGKRLCAAALCTTMVLGNLGTLANAADNNKDPYDFKLDRASLYEALQKAVQEGNTVDELNFRGPDAEDYQNLLNADGTLYELKPEIKDNNGKMQLRVFARIEDDINVENDIDVENDTDGAEVYEVDGSEEMIFLLVNTSEYEKKAVIHVDEKVTEAITVAPAKAVEVSEEGPHITMNPERVPASAVPGGGSGGSGSGGSGGGGGGSSETKVEVVKQEEDKADIIIKTNTETDPEQTEDPEQQKPAENDTQDPADAQKPGTSNEEDSNAGQDDTDKGENPDDGQQNSTGNEDDGQTEEKSNENESDSSTANESEKDGGNSTEGEAGNAAGDSSEAGSDIDGSNHGNTESSQGGESGNGRDTDHSTEGEAGSEKSGGKDSGSDTDSNTGDHDSGKDSGNSGSDSGHDGGSKESSVSVLSISRHRTSLVAAAASPSNADKAETATVSDASPSDAEHTLDGDVPYGTIRLGSDSAIAFVTTLEQIGINAGGHLDPCEVGCSGENCDCICHKILHGLLSKLDTYVNTVRGYTSETEPELFDEVAAEVSALFEQAQEAGLTDEELEYFTEAYEAAYAKIAELIAGYQAEIRKGQEVTVILHDIQPDGEEAAKPIKMMAAADTTLKTAFLETNKTLELSDCIWYEINDATGEKTQVNLDAEVEEGMELYTYTYDVTLTLVEENANRNAGIMMMSLDDEETDTKETDKIQASLTISAREGKTLSASDFVKDDVDYTRYTWTTDTSETLDLRSLVENGVTENISATAYADQGISVAAISESDTVAVGDTITLSSNIKSIKHEWYQQGGSGEVNVNGNGATASVTGVKAGEVTVVHKYRVSTWYGGYDDTETFTVTVTTGNEGALVYYLLSPTSDPDSNATSQWGPAPVKYNNNDATVNTTGAEWTNNKNIFKQNADLSDYIISWPDGSEEATWTLDKEIYGEVYRAVYEQYRNELANTTGITDLTLGDIEEITLVPHKISKDNGTTPDKHIDCTISVKCSRAYVARFNVQMPNDTDYTNVHAENKKIVNDRPESVEKYVNQETVPETKIVDGITYVFDGWYNEAGEKIADEKWNYVPNEEELADGTVNFYARYVRSSVNVSIKKSVSGIMGDRSRKFKFTVISDAANSEGQNSWTFEIRHNETKDLGSIPAGAELTISEIDADKYTMSVVDGIKENDEATYTYTIKNNEDGKITIEVINTKDGNVDAGVLLDSLPYILILAAVAAAAAFFLIRRRRENDNDLD